MGHQGWDVPTIEEQDSYTGSHHPCARSRSYGREALARIAANGLFTCNAGAAGQKSPQASFSDGLCVCCGYAGLHRDTPLSSVQTYRMVIPV